MSESRLIRKMRCGQLGQGLVETALVAPLLIVLVIGVWDAAGLSSVENQATTATRDGARLAASLGNQLANPVTGPFDPTSIDQQVVATVVASMQGAPNTVVNQVDIYEPDPPPASGRENPADRIDSYQPDGTPIGSPGYTLQFRIQTPGAESYVGVMVYFTYTAPAPLLPFFSGQKTIYTVMQLVPVG
jgi:hypothetical protein